MQMNEGIYFVGGRCYRVVKLFDECTQRREKISQEAARLYRSGRHLGGCMIMYEIAPELCAALKPK